MTDMQLELNNPAMLRALLDVPTMQRWEILRRAQRTLSVAQIAEESGTTLEATQRSLDWLAEAGLVRKHRASARRRQVAYRAAMERLFLVWDRGKPADVAAMHAVDEYMRNHSRSVQDEAIRLVRTDGLEPKNVGGAISVVLDEEDSMRVREAFRALYEMVVEADQRARDGAGRARSAAYHIVFSQTRLRQPQAPMAEFFVIDKDSARKDRTVFMQAPSKVLSPREFQIARLLEAGRSRPAIAAELGLTPNTVSSIGKIIYRKLGVRSRAELAVRMR